ncbi:ABC transporter permease [Xanthobacter sp. V4C-4]|uniref:ABC transporter permease n=1 Tax=Xanthobacter cornucopiae TaxID=3119924 RepID=UPI00372C1DC4
MNDVFTSALKNQGRSLMAMLMAEYSARVSKRSLGIVEEIFSLGVVAGSMLVLRLMSGAPTHHGMPVFPFVLSGLVLFWMFRTTLFRVSSFKTAKAGFRNNPRVTALDVLAARGILNVIFYIFLGFPIFLTLYFLDLSPFMSNPGEVFLIMVLMGIWGISLGLCFGALFLYMPFMRLVVQGMMMMLMWVSGVMFIWAEAPYMLRWLIIYNPIFHFMELMRSAYFGSYVTPVGDWSFVLTTVAVSLALGLMLERVTRKRAENAVQRQAADDDAFDGEMA